MLPPSSGQKNEPEEQPGRTGNKQSWLEKDGGYAFLQNVGRFLPVYTASHPRR
jgi:hypothetical protein